MQPIRSDHVNHQTSDGRGPALLLVWLAIGLSACDRHTSESALVAWSPIVARAALERANAGDEDRFALRGAHQRLPLGIPPAASLQIGFALSPPPDAKTAISTWPSGLEFVDFTVDYQDERGPQRLAQRRIVRPADGQLQWQDVQLDLGALAGRQGMLALAASGPGGQLADSDVVWSAPRITTPGASTATSVILISIDTLRADHLGCYGYAAPTSPNIDHMAGEGVLFRNFVASSPWTLPSHASMLTGLDPERHGVVKFWVHHPLPPQLDTLAELLWDCGYETAGVIGGGYLSRDWNFNQGFDRYVQQGGAGKPDALQTAVDRAKPWLSSRQGRPFFLFLHTYQVHQPYEPPPPYDTLFDPDYRGPYEKRFTDRDRYEVEQAHGLDQAGLRHVQALYDGEIRAMDDAVGDLLAFLRANRLDRQTCVFFTSDHGEEFDEHGDLGHQHSKLYEELIHVPLIVWCPSRFHGGNINDALGSHTDVVPTILDLAGIAAPAGLDGRSLLPTLTGDTHEVRAATLSEVDGSVDHHGGGVRAIRTARYKLIQWSIDGSEVLFDLTADRAERTDLRAQHPDIAQAVRSRVSDRPRGPVVAAAPAVTPDSATRERLHALGYVR